MKKLLLGGALACLAVAPASAQAPSILIPACKILTVNEHTNAALIAGKKVWRFDASSIIANVDSTLCAQLGGTVTIFPAFIISASPVLPPAQ